MATVILGNEFDKEVLQSDVPVLVDFFATWCGPCKMIAPILEDISEEASGKMKVVKLDVDEARNIAAQYKVMSVPTLLFFKSGEIVGQIIGAVPKNIVVQKMEQILA